MTETMKTETVATLIAPFAESGGWAVDIATAEVDRFRTYPAKFTKDGRIIFVKLTDGGKVHVWGGWDGLTTDRGEKIYPYDSDYQEISTFPRHGINISAKKAPSAIWAEIERRFLFAYELLFGRLKKRSENWNEHNIRVTGIADQIEALKIPGMDRDSPDHLGNKSDHFRYYDDEVGSGRVEVNSGDSVDVHFDRLKPELAIKILELIRDI